MNLDQIETKCFILALFIRDDNERFLLGSRAYEFLDSQLHFAANTYQNDVVEVQGNDGIMLAGQVRRATSQAFDGYIGDSSVDRPTIEQYRQAFLKFFRKNHYYKVVYVFPDGSAIQRRNGFIVEAPEVKELYQLFPQYHISMNFEDINYYEYKEDEDGQEIYGESASLNVSTSATGGLIWDAGTQATISGEGTNFTLNNTIYGNSIDNVQLKGDTTQQTYSGKNLFDGVVASGEFSSSGNINANPNRIYSVNYIKVEPNTQYVANKQISRVCFYDTNKTFLNRSSSFNFYTFTTPANSYFVRFDASTSIDISSFQLEKGSTATTYEPYVGGIPAPNPDYPQTVNNVTGRQVVTISDGDSQSQSYEVNLGKNLFNVNNTLSNQYLNASGGWSTSGSTPAYNNFEMSVAPSSQFAISYSARANATIRIGEFDSSGTFIQRTLVTTEQTFTLGANTTKVIFSIDQSETVYFTNLQIEKGSTVTTYAEYFAPIELCKIGTYQDYIYKNGDDWYLHKEIEKKIFNGTENWQYGVSNKKYSLEKSSNLSEFYLPNNTLALYMDSFRAGGADTIGYIVVGNTYINVNYDDAGTSAGLATFKSWLGTNGATLYAPLVTATDTKITNAALVAQLNALAAATTYAEKTVFTVNSENQLGILSLSTQAWLGAGVVWDNYGATWEEGTGGGPTMISVDSIDNVYPIWEVTGPAVNPQISVLTTNTTLSYTGTVTASQVLKVDMFNKTATLNGTSVVGNVSGDWTYLAPGTNRVTYTTTNADAPDSTLWWQEIVG